MSVISAEQVVLKWKSGLVRKLILFWFCSSFSPSFLSVAQYKDFHVLYIEQTLPGLVFDIITGDVFTDLWL